MTPWYVLRCATRQEAKAVASLAEMALKLETTILVYLPQLTRWKRTTRTKEKVQAPLFEGYLFVQCDAEDFAPILDLEGVHQFVRYMPADGIPRPMPIHPSEIDKVRKAEEAGQYDLTRPSRKERERAERWAKAMKRGEDVKITEGPFGGFIGKIIEMRMSDRAALVDVELFGRPTRVELPVGHLDAA